jgi:transposase
VKRCAQPVTAEARVIGIDEWAKRKGRTYGTIVVDLERHAVIDVLDEHSTKPSSSGWGRIPTSR